MTAAPEGRLLVFMSKAERLVVQRLAQEWRADAQTILAQYLIQRWKCDAPLRERFESAANFFHHIDGMFVGKRRWEPALLPPSDRISCHKTKENDHGC